MKYNSYPNEDYRSSIANTTAPIEMRTKFGRVLLVENAVKDGIETMFWTCLCIGLNGRYFIDVRELPKADESLIKQHSAIRVTPKRQRAIALKMIDAAFKDLAELLAWCEAEAYRVTDWRKI